MKKRESYHLSGPLQCVQPGIGDMCGVTLDLRELDERFISILLHPATSPKRDKRSRSAQHQGACPATWQLSNHNGDMRRVFNTTTIILISSEAKRG
jgi:hypothetical protein